MAVCVKGTMAINSCLLITRHDNIMETMFQHMVTELIHLIKRNRSRKIEASIRPVTFKSVYISSDILPAIYGI